MSKHQAVITGHLAEIEARSYLEQQGLTYLTHHYRSPFGEIDLIMEDHETIAFVEVKMRTRIDFGHAYQSVTRAKQNRIIKTAIHFLQKKGWLYKINSRFDVIAIEPNLKNHGKLGLTWIQNAFETKGYC